MNLDEIKQAVDAGKIICWKNDNYLVEKGGPWGYWVIFDDKPLFGLTPFNIDGHESDYFILENP
jgi:hypothetical protein